METALRLFSTKGYGDTSMSDISSLLSMTKAALYKHFTSKEEILATIIREMDEEDLERAEKYSVPVGSDGMREEGVERKSFSDYALSQFVYWTENERCARYRRMLSLERFKNPLLKKKWDENFVSGPIEYTANTLSAMGMDDVEERAFLLWGAVFLSYSLFDSGVDNDKLKKRLKREIDKIMEVEDELSEE
ncbi:MAG: TetR/AcrR family transcriptional regulator [Candidatus Ornithospirochaeta sp.]